MTRPRLLVVSHDYSLTGAPIALFNALPGLKGSYDIQVVSQQDGPLRENLINCGIPAQLVPDVLSNAQVAAGLLASFDLLLTNTLLSCVPIYAAHHHNKPSLWYIHEGKVGFQLMERCKPVMAGAFPLVRRVVVPCRFSRELYTPLLGNKPVDIVPYGVPNQELPPPPPYGPIQVLQMGSIEVRKGQDIALAAFRLLNDDRFKLHLVGQTLDHGYQQQVMSHFADVRQVRYWGGVSKEHATTLMADCDLLIVPSRDEVTPVVILEAMAVGKTVIASRICGIPEMIEDTQTGFLFESENAKQLAELIRRLGDDPKLRRQVGLRGREYQRQQRTLEQCSARLDPIIREMLAGG